MSRTTDKNTAATKHRILAIFLSILIGVALISAWAIGENALRPFHLKFTVAHLAFLLGATLELRKISGNWKSTFQTIGISALVGLFITGHILYKTGTYRNAGFFLPTLFSLALLIVFIFRHRKDVTPRIGEGVTLLHSLALLYFFFDRFQSGLGSHWWIFLSLPPTVYSAIHAVTYIEMSPRHRLFLSLWSSIAMMIFGAVYVTGLLAFSDIEKLFQEDGLWTALFVSIEYILLGASGPYIAQNVFMLYQYIPRKYEDGPDYKSRVRDLNEEHVERYSKSQIHRKEALFIIVLFGGALLANLKFEFVTRNFAISFCLILGPILAELFGRLTAKEMRP